MPIINDNKKCAFCEAYLFEDDEVVYCPVCGAPHHKECYNKNGDCALKEYHGTENEYSPKKEQESPADTDSKNPADDFVCPNCKKTINSDSVFCPYCRYVINPISNPFNTTQYFGFDKNGEIDGIKIKDLLSFIFVNPVRYIQKFINFSKGARFSWNWIAFLFPAPWMFMRKMYKKASLAFAVTLAALILMLPLTAEMNSVILDDISVPYSSIIVAKEVLSNAAPSVIITGMAGALIYLATGIFVAVNADKYYRDHAFAKIKSIKAENSLADSSVLQKAGSINIWWFLLSYFALKILPSVISIFIL